MTGRLEITVLGHVMDLLLHVLVIKQYARFTEVTRAIEPPKLHSK